MPKKDFAVVIASPPGLSACAKGILLGTGRSGLTMTGKRSLACGGRSCFELRQRGLVVFAGLLRRILQKAKGLLFHGNCLVNVPRVNSTVACVSRYIAFSSSVFARDTAFAERFAA